MNALSAGVLDLLQLPFAPLIEFVKALDGFNLDSPSPSKKIRPDSGPNRGGLVEDIHLGLYLKERDPIYRRREILFERALNDGPSIRTLAEFRAMAHEFQELGRRMARSIDQERGAATFAQKIVLETESDAARMNDLADDMEEILSSPSPSATMPDPKMLAALDRLGFSLEDLANLTQQAVQNRYRERAKRFHPDTKGDGEKAFYEDQMKRLNEAKDLLIASLER